MVVLYPGSFKPVHPGHVRNILAYAEKPENKVIVIISNAEREGITAGSSLDFLNSVFENYPNVRIEVSSMNSPVRSAYSYTLNRSFGDDEYVLLSSGKDNDMKRSEDYVKSFSPGGKYADKGIRAALPHAAVGITDFANGEHMSSTIIRDMIRRGDKNGFINVYGQLVDMGLTNLGRIRFYFNVLRSDMSQAGDGMFESTKIGHIKHPYEYPDITFGEMKDLIADICEGKVPDVTEKIDGISLYASMDDDGNPIFARNLTQMREAFLHPEELTGSRRYAVIGISEAMKKACETICEVFGDMSMDYFNHMSGDVFERVWISMEVVDRSSRNVVKYDKDFISVHGCKTLQMTRGRDVIAMTDTENDVSGDIFDDMRRSIARHRNTPMEMMFTPKPKLKRINPSYYIHKLTEIQSEYDLMDDSTIGDYKKECFRKFLKESHAFSMIDGEALDVLLSRWAYGKRGMTLVQTMNGISNAEGHGIIGKTLNMIGRFEKDGGLKELDDKCMMEIKSVFMEFGNAVLNSMSGSVADGGRLARMNTKNALDDVASRMERTYSLKDKTMLDMNMRVMRGIDNISASEGIVFTWKGMRMKLTGYYPVLNRMIGFDNGQ